jgi:phosphomannomutase
MIKHKFEAARLGHLDQRLKKVSDTFSDARVNTADGVRIDFDDGWVHLRPSNTEPIVRLIAEAPTRERAWELIDEVAVAAGLR